MKKSAFFPFVYKMLKIQEQGETLKWRCEEFVVAPGQWM